MTTTLYLIRHGETDGGDTRRYHGSIDIPLSERGRQQIAEKTVALTQHLSQWVAARYLSYLRDMHGTTEGAEDIGRDAQELSAVYCSDLSRAIQSAEIICRARGLSPVRMAALRERSFGVWEGMSFAEIRERYPEEFGAWATNPLAHSPIGGETTLQVKDRVIGAVDTILRDHAGHHVAIVAHGGVNRIILCHVLGMPFDNIFRIEQDFAALNIIEFWDTYPVLKLLNG
ncbi:MAG TPA: histidine phosphatase family protein [Thermodesulfovibrionales bacterium]|nr:histidine phosphatase family protein [Thermodesulfovibrionales bacterium]